MTRQSDAQNAAILRPVADALIGHDDVRRAREHDRTHERGGRLRGDRVSGVLPRNTTGTVQGDSVQVPASDFSASQNLADQLAAMAAAIRPWLEGTATWNPGSIAPGASETTTVTVTGAALGDPVIVGFSSITTANWILSATVTAANTVSVVLQARGGGSTVDLGSGTLRVAVMPA